MSGLLDVEMVCISRELFENGHAMLRDIGKLEVEGLVLWAGRRRVNAPVFEVEAVLKPAQNAYRTKTGLLVLVDGPELHRIGVWLYEQRMQLIAQLHSHPTDAYHSATDDAIPVVATEGALSLVVPHFGRGAPVIEDYSCHRLDSSGEWRQLSAAESRVLIRLDP